MSVARAALRTCREAARRRWHVGRTSLAAASNHCLFSTSRNVLQPIPVAGSVPIFGNCSNTTVFTTSVRRFSQEAETLDLDEDDDDPILGMKLLTMNDDKTDDKQFAWLWRQVEKKPSKALRTVHDWIARGNQLSKEAVIKICLKLCHLRRQTRALEIIDWVIADKPYRLTSRDYGLQIRLTCRYRSAAKAERIFQNVPDDMKTDDEVAIALLTSLSRSDYMNRTWEWYKCLKVKSPRVCNMMMILYLRRNRHNEAIKFYNDLREAGVEPNALTYLLLLKYKDKIGVPEGIEKEAEAAMDKIDIKDENLKDAILSDIMVVYAYLNKPKKVEAIWGLLKKEQWTLAGRFVAAITAFGILGSISKAEQALEDVVATKKKAIQKPYCAMIGVYAKYGMMDRAEETMMRLKKELFYPWFAPYNHLVTGYLAAQEPKKAYATLMEGLDYVDDKRIVPDYDMVVGMMPVFASKSDVAGAERLMRLFGGYGDARLYNELLKVYQAAGVALPVRFLERMQSQSVEPDEETRRLLTEATSDEE